MSSFDDEDESQGIRRWSSWIKHGGDRSVAEIIRRRLDDYLPNQVIETLIRRVPKSQKEETEYDLILKLLEVNTRYLNNKNINKIAHHVLIWILKKNKPETKVVIIDDKDLKINDDNGETLLFGGMKGFTRLLTKTILEYNGNPDRCCDIIRFTIKIPFMINSIDSFRQQLLTTFTRVLHNDKIIFKMCKMKSSVNGYFITQWVCVLQPEIVNLILKKSYDKIKMMDADDQIVKIDASRSRTTVKEDNESVRIILGAENEDKGIVLYSQLKGSKPQIFRFEIQFKYEEGGEHFSYEWDRLVIVNNQFQFKVQKTIINEMMEKCSQNESLKNLYMAKLKTLYECENLQIFNQELLKMKNLIIDFV